MGARVIPVFAGGLVLKPVDAYFYERGVRESQSRAVPRLRTGVQGSVRAGGATTSNSEKRKRIFLTPTP